MRYYGSAVVLAGFVLAVGSPEVRAADPKGYVVEPPDILRLDVTELRKKAQPVRGEFVVRPDGTVSLGGYGTVTVSGLTLDQARGAIAKHLSAHAKKKGKVEVRAEVSAANSKAYYVIRSGTGGEQVYRFPAGAGETVVGAVLRVEGLSAVAASGRVWVAGSSSKVREVNWRAITQEGRSPTNYGLEAGDRVYVGDAPPK
jgi:polysaccharide biosynthesis/export protein